MYLTYTTSSRFQLYLITLQSVNYAITAIFIHFIYIAQHYIRFYALYILNCSVLILYHNLCLLGTPVQLFFWTAFSPTKLHTAFKVVGH